MMRLVRLTPFLLLASASHGCTCGARRTYASTDAAVSSVRVGEAHPPSDFAASDAVFSAPIAAASVGQTAVIAGLVNAEGTVRVMSLRDGQLAWAADALHGVAWAPDVELKLLPASDGIALVWRGIVAGKPGRTLVLLGPRGEPRGEPIEVGSSLCATSEGLAWIDPHTSGPTRVRARRWGETLAQDVVVVPPDRDPELVCGNQCVFVLGDGDDDLTSTTFVAGEGAAHRPTFAIRDADFGDEEREHEAYTVGDSLGLVRVAGSGGIAMREILRSGESTAWRKLKHVLAADEDVVSVDGDADATLIVYTHDAEDACPGVASSAESIRALRVDRTTGAESVLDLAPVDCERSYGPFWIASAPGSLVVAWVERHTKLPPKAAAISGLAFRVVRSDGVRAGRADVLADALVDGGCNDRGCFAAALVRSPDDGDGMHPEPILALSYP
jgi:hypothetical protein